MPHTSAHAHAHTHAPLGHLFRQGVHTETTRVLFGVLNQCLASKFSIRGAGFEQGQRKEKVEATRAQANGRA